MSILMTCPPSQEKKQICRLIEQKEFASTLTIKTKSLLRLELKI